MYDNSISTAMLDAHTHFWNMVVQNKEIYYLENINIQHNILTVDRKTM